MEYIIFDLSASSWRITRSANGNCPRRKTISQQDSFRSRSCFTILTGNWALLSLYVYITTPPNPDPASPSWQETEPCCLICLYHHSFNSWSCFTILAGNWALLPYLFKSPLLQILILLHHLGRKLRPAALICLYHHSSKSWSCLTTLTGNWALQRLYT